MGKKDKMIIIYTHSNKSSVCIKIYPKHTHTHTLKAIISKPSGCVSVLYFHFKSALWALFPGSVQNSPNHSKPLPSTIYQEQLQALYHTKGEMRLKVLFFCPPECPFSHHTPGQIMSQPFVKKSESYFSSWKCNKISQFSQDYTFWLYMEPFPLVSKQSAE